MTPPGKAYLRGAITLFPVSGHGPDGFDVTSRKVDEKPSGRGMRSTPSKALSAAGHTAGCALQSMRAVEPSCLFVCHVHGHRHPGPA